MKKALGIFVAAVFIFCSSLAFAGGDQQHGDVGSGSTGDSGAGDVTQNHGG